MPAFIPPLLGLIGLLIALGIFRVVLSYPEAVSYTHLRAHET